ncbi:hypothetical protein BT69DRAFT_1327715 [Atractiella rhizophila]|nr:hypothetical protein BT69DRAFT_1327715 [Atractiella rhizophila]
MKPDEDLSPSRGYIVPCGATIPTSSPATSAPLPSNAFNVFNTEFYQDGFFGGTMDQGAIHFGMGTVCPTDIAINQDAFGHVALSDALGDGLGGSTIEFSPATWETVQARMKEEVGEDWNLNELLND